MSTIEYPAMVYRNNRNRVFVANCFMKNIIGFGKTEQEAINNLKSTLQNIEHDCNIVIRPTHDLLAAQ